MTVISSELPLRPRPKSGETLLGYILRVSHLNGYRQVQTIRDLFGLKSTPFHYVSSNYRGLDDLVNIMSVRLRILPKELIQHFKLEESSTYDTYRAVQDISIRQPKICLACMCEERPMLAKWRLAHVTHCELHSTPLLRHCPSCSAEMKWKPSLYSCCDKCGVDWKVLNLTNEKIPLYQSVEHSMTNDQIVAYHRSLYKMVRLSLRFYDMQKCEFRVFPYDVDDNLSLFDFSYRLLVDKAFRKQQLQHRILFWKKSACLHHIPKHFFEALHDEYQESISYLSNTEERQIQPFHVSRFQSSRISNPRMSLVNHSFDAHVQLDINTLARCLRLTTPEVSSAVKKGLLVTINETNMPRDYWFSAEDINELYGRLAKKYHSLQDCQSPSHLMQLRDVMAIIRRFKLTVADILKLILTDRCDAYVDTESESFELLSLYVNREQLFSELGQLFFATQKEISNHCIALLFFIPPDYLIQFLHFLQHKGAEQSSLEQNLEHSALYFIENYVVLNQWCRLRKISIPKVRQYLTSKDINPVFSISSTHGIFVFKRTEKLENTLRKFVESNMLQQ